MYATPGTKLYEYARPPVFDVPRIVAPPQIKQEMPTRVQTKRARTESYTKTKTKKRPRRKADVSFGEGGFRYYKKFKGLSARRRRRFKKRERYGMSRRTFLGAPSIFSPPVSAPVNNMVFGDTSMLVDPMDLKGFLSGYVDHSFGRVQIPFIGIKGLLINHTSCTMNYRVVYGTVESSINSINNLHTFAAARPPQTNTYLGSPLYRGLWYRISGSNRYKVPAGGRLNFKVGVNMGSKILDSAYINKYQIFACHILFWPELTTDVGPINTAPIIAFPDIKYATGWFQPLWHVWIAKQYTSNIEKVNTGFLGLQAPLVEFEAKAEDIMTKATT